MNNDWSYIFSNMSGTWVQTSTNMIMAAFIGRYVWYISATSCRTVTTYFIHRATNNYSWAIQPTKVVKAMYIDHNGHITLWLTLMEAKQSLTVCQRKIFKMEQGAFHLLFCLQRQPIVHLWIFESLRTPYYPSYTTNNRGCFFEAHCHVGAEGVSQSVLPIKTANDSCMTTCNLSAVWFPRTHDQ